jgi:hypothetical protein
MLLISLHSLEDITFKQEVIRGTVHRHDPEIFTKDEFLSRAYQIDGIVGCTVSGSLITDKAGGNFQLITAPVENPAKEGDGAVHSLDDLLIRGGFPNMLAQKKAPNLKYQNVYF